MNEKTSPYIYPFRPFLHLDIAEENARFSEPQTLPVEGYSGWLERFAPEIAVTPAATIEETIFSIFADDAVRFGERTFVTDLQAHWIERIARFTTQGRMLEMTILGFPYKMPVPLKTNRKLADFGEVVSLARLNQIGCAIARVYAPGAKSHVFTEGPFGAFNGVSRADSDAYFASLENLLVRFGLNQHVALHDLNAVVDANPDFAGVWAETAKDIERRRDAGDQKVLDAIRDALPVRFHNLANPGVADLDLARAYRRDPAAQELINSIQRRAESGVVTYRAFLEARDRVQLLERVAPEALAMTVSPRPGRLGVRSLPPPAQILPYHGVTVIARDGQGMDISYLWDLRRSSKSYTPLSLDGDTDPAPFAYIES
ncbi:L-tyrosine/L-tryptophan isonitrile synthase family protein [Devosia sp. LjRoot3]|uniref:L-tyrosine/L-tryptophan isonitrile synthase family protein n=1 Tax=Devosia sp. LjRoot3 TaxID=3342319 RepID=UPI003ED08791